jgi:hypothetical protein
MPLRERTTLQVENQLPLPPTRILKDYIVCSGTPSVEVFSRVGGHNENGIIGSRLGQTKRRWERCGYSREQSCLWFQATGLER